MTHELIRHDGCINMLDLTNSNIRAWHEVCPELGYGLPRALFIPTTAESRGLTLGGYHEIEVNTNLTLVSVRSVELAVFRMGEAYVRLELLSNGSAPGAEMYLTRVIAPSQYGYNLVGVYLCPPSSENYRCAAASEEDVATYTAFMQD